MKRCENSGSAGIWSGRCAESGTTFSYDVLLSEYTIGEVAQRAGIHPSAMRYYEHIGLLPPPRRVNGRRRYGADVLLSLRYILLSQQAGFTLGEIRELLAGVAAATPLSLLWHHFATRKIEELDDVIAQAQARQRLLSLLMLCECETLEQCAFINEPEDLVPEAQPCL